MTTTPTSPAETLRGLCEGRVHLPGDAAYDATRTAWNLCIDQRPAAVAVPRSADEVVDVVRAAVAAGLRIAPQSTGHGAGPFAGRTMADVVLLRLHELTGVTVDPAAGTARIVGGTEWREVIAATEPHGFTAAHGSAPDVAAVGYLLGGGLSFFGRAHGLAANHVRAVELVTAAGELLRVSEDEHPDLFWAVRGGGGSFGVVVAVEIALLPYAEVYAGMLLWDRERAPEVVRAWAAWTREAPTSATTSLRLMSFPPLPELPPFLSGRQIVVVDGAILEADERAGDLLAPLRALAPEMDTFGRIPATAVTDVHMDPPTPVPAMGADALLADFDEDAAAALLAFNGPGTATALMFTEVRHLGGALADTASGPATVAAPYVLLGVAAVPFPEAAAPAGADLDRMIEVMAPHAAPGHFLNFAERSVDPAEVHGDRWERLRTIRAAVDPTGVLVANHPV